MRGIWTILTNAIFTVALVALAIGTGAREFWFVAYSIMIALLVVGIVLEAKGSRWSGRWNVGIFVVILVGAL